jgi:small-conductance mechanosensitive channel
VVIFSEFGDSALTFELIFWIHLEQLIQRRVILSEIRYKIENAFDKAGIVISFPQRDIHFVNEKPLEIKIKKER